MYDIIVVELEQQTESMPMKKKKPLERATWAATKGEIEEEMGLTQA